MPSMKDAIGLQTLIELHPENAGPGPGTRVSEGTRSRRQLVHGTSWSTCHFVP